MNNTMRHPFNQIAGYNSLSMLENLIPFVDHSLKLPLALFIKVSQIQLIVRTLQNPEECAQCGLHNTSSKPSDIFAAVTGLPPEILDLFFSKDATSPLSSLLGGLANSSATDTENLFSSFSTTAPSDMETIDALFAAYDQQQANQDSTPGD